MCVREREREMRRRKRKKDLSTEQLVYKSASDDRYGQKVYTGKT